MSKRKIEQLGIDSRTHEAEDGWVQAAMAHQTADSTASGAHQAAAIGAHVMATNNGNGSKAPRYTVALPELDDVRGGIQDALTALGEYTTAASGNKYFTIQRKPLVVNGLAGELSVTWNNLRDADKVAMAEAATIEQMRQRLAEYDARKRRETQGS